MLAVVIAVLVVGMTISKLSVAEECAPTFVDCYCESNFENFIQVPVSTSLQKDKLSGLISCMADEYAPDVCGNKNCSLIPNENFKSLFGNGKKTLKQGDLKHAKTRLHPKQKRSVQQELNFQISANYPQEIIFSPNDDAKWGREKRSYESCKIPNLQNAEVTCWKWPNWITCNQVCISGHGLSDGGSTVTKTSMNCRFTENTWKPNSIQDCKPFINCRAHLVSPGDLNCVQMVKEPSYCEIRCDEYDGNEETDLVKYTCDQKFKLPHCAVLDDAVSLINPPSK